MEIINIDKVVEAFRLQGKKFAILDFESSKIDSLKLLSKDSLGVGLPIQIGALQYDEHQNLKEIAKYINQGNYNPENDMIETKDKFFSITELTGVTKAHLQSEEFAEQRITECELTQLGFVDGLIIGYNISYDVRTLKEVYKRCGVPFESVQLVDVMGIFIDLYGNRPGFVKYGFNRSLNKPHYENYRLDHVAHKLRVVASNEQQEHDALSDVKWTLAVLNKIIEDFPDLDYSRYINKIYYNPCYEIPSWQKLIAEGVSYYPFGTAQKEARIWPQFTLYNYENFNENDW